MMKALRECEKSENLREDSSANSLVTDSENQEKVHFISGYGSELELGSNVDPY